ncbi:MAG: hypothetical protein ACRDRQ_18345 [Pseudonocardiaceae bacterium]
MYRLIIYPEAQEQVAALPDEALDGYAEVLNVLELVPWSGEPQHKDNPDAAVRRWIFGSHGAGHHDGFPPSATDPEKKELTIAEVGNGDRAVLRECKPGLWAIS